MKKVNLVIIGCGAITEKRHAPECYASEKINLAGFFDINLERAKEFAKKYECKAYETYEKVLNDTKVDGVIICTNNKFHCDMTVQAFEHKKHVLCEKPMAVTVEEGKRMIEAGEKAGCFLMIAHNQRLMPVNMKLKEILTTRNLGKILTFTTTFNHRGPEFWSVNKTNKTWFMNKKEAGLGALGDIGIHKADLVRWFIGENIKYVTSVLATRDKKDGDGNLIAMEDNAFAILESESGIIGTIEASWTHYGKYTNRTMICCENGVVEVPDETHIIVHDTNWQQEVFEIAGANSLMADTFADCIAKGVQPEISGEEGLKALEIVLACVESSETHSRVELS